MLTRGVYLIAFLAAATLLSAGCKEQSEPQTSGGQKSPADKFAANLADAEFVNYDVAIGGGGSLTYQTLDFEADGTWSADAELKLAKEPFDCVESGTWEITDGGPIDTFSSRVDFRMNDTDCPGRDTQKKQKLEIRIQGKGNRPQIIDL
jgi:hypothetical protein